MDNCLNAMVGDASTGGLIDLKTAYHALDAILLQLPPPKSAAAHEILENIQTWLCDGGTYSNGAANQSAEYTAACKNYL